MMLFLGLADVPFWFAFILIIITVLYFYTARKHSLFRRYGIPAITPTPFVGGLPLIMKKGIMKCEYDAITDYGKCVGYFLGNLPTVFLTDPEIIREIFVKRFPDYPNRSQSANTTQFWQKTVLQTNKYDNWRFLRSILSPAFSSGKLRKLDRIVLNCITHATEQLKDKIRDSGTTTDIMPFFQELTLDVICQSAMGVKLDSEKSASTDLRKHVSRLLHFSLEKNPWLLLIFIIPDMKKLLDIFDIDFNNTTSIAYVQKCLESVVQERKQDKMASEYRDILQLMVNTNLEHHKGNKVAKKDEEKEEADEETHTEKEENLHDLEKPSRGMTDDEIIANAITFLFAGYETTATALTWAAYFLATQQECQEKIVKEIETKIGKSELNFDTLQQMTYLDMFVSESMRLYPPVTRLNRQNYQDTKIGKYTFPGGISITVPVFTLHRMPEFWSDPERFEPERFSAENKKRIMPYTYVPFGLGPRNCIGMRFAMLELKMALVKLLQNFTIKQSPELKVPPELEKNVFCRPVGGMKLLLERRK